MTKLPRNEILPSVAQTMPSLKVLVQDKATRCFFVAPNSWTQDPAAAHNFKRIFRAIDFCSERNFLTASIVILCKRSIFNTCFTPLPRLSP
jgi:hypothetical protein